jgi:predicted DNA-binding transcriptional regulator YafY
MRLSGLEEIERWILTWGTHAHVIAPQTLTERIVHTLSDLADRYKKLTANPQQLN